MTSRHVWQAWSDAEASTWLIYHVTWNSRSTRQRQCCQVGCQIQRLHTWTFVKPHPDSFGSFCCVCFVQASRSRRESDRTVTKLGAKSVLDEPRVELFWLMLSKLDVPFTCIRRGSPDPAITLSSSHNTRTWSLLVSSPTTWRHWISAYGRWELALKKAKDCGCRSPARWWCLPEWDNPHVAHAEARFNECFHNVHLGGKFADSHLLVLELAGEQTTSVSIAIGWVLRQCCPSISNIHIWLKCDACFVELLQSGVDTTVHNGRWMTSCCYLFESLTPSWLEPELAEIEACSFELLTSKEKLCWSSESSESLLFMARSDSFSEISTSPRWLCQPETSDVTSSRYSIVSDPAYLSHNFQCPSTCRCASGWVW